MGHFSYPTDVEELLSHVKQVKASTLAMLTSFLILSLAKATISTHAHGSLVFCNIQHSLTRSEVWLAQMKKSCAFVLIKDKSSRRTDSYLCLTISTDHSIIVALRQSSDFPVNLLREHLAGHKGRPSMPQLTVLPLWQGLATRSEVSLAMPSCKGRSG